MRIDPGAAVPPFEQVRAQFAAQIADGTLVVGTRLPTVRKLADDLGLAVNTVARAYRELESAGLVETRGRAGTVVSAAGDRTQQNSSRPRGPTPRSPTTPGPTSSERSRSSAPRSLLIPFTDADWASGVEAEAEAIEQAQPRTAPALVAVGASELVTGELDSRPAHRLGRERQRRRRCAFNVVASVRRPASRSSISARRSASPRRPGRCSRRCTPPVRRGRCPGRRRTAWTCRSHRPSGA